MTTQKKLLAYHINRLQDKSPEIRLKAIKELELLGDPEALEPLKALYNTDSDVEVRKAAQDAGRTIYLRQSSQNNS